MASADVCFGVRSRAQGGEYLIPVWLLLLLMLLLLNVMDTGDPGREPWCREDDEVGRGE